VGTLRTDDADNRDLPQAPSDDERRSILDLFKR
jgi:hypothetical protein